MAIGLLVTLTVHEGKNAEFEQLFLNMAEQIRAREPGTIFYVLHRSRADSQVYKVMEQYEDAEAMMAHGKTDYYREANTVLGPLVAAMPEIEVLDTV